MKKLVDGGMVLLMVAWVLVMVWFLTGCGTSKARHLDIGGGYASKSGTIAIGSIEVQSAPEGTESAMIRYEDEVAMFSEKKEHSINVLLTGTNSTASAIGIVKCICKAFIATAPAIVTGTNAPACKCNPCKCDPCKCGAREPEDKSEEPPPQELPSI